MTIRNWTGVLALEDVQTGDGRVFAADSLEWADPPLPLAWLVDGDQHVYSDAAPVIGNIESLERVGGDIRGSGIIDDGDDPESAGGQVIRMMDEGTAPFGNEFGVSVDGDDWDMEVVSTTQIEEDGVLILASGTGPVPSFRAAAGDPDPGEGGGESGDQLFEEAADDFIMRFRRMRIRGATLCAVPAFGGARIHLEGAQAAVEEPATVAAVVAHAASAASAAAAPPVAFFANPELPDLQRWVTDTEDGRIFGHLAGWNECHIGYPGECVTPELLTAGGLEFATPGHVVTAGGDVIGTMPLAIKGGHADWRGRAAFDWRAAQAHYDDTAAAFADVAVGFDDHGIWFSGALRPGVTYEQVRVYRASGVSGDWREIGGKTRLIGACSVNTPGFPKVQVHMASGRVVALVAAGGRPLPADPALRSHGEDCGCDENAALTRRLERLEDVNAEAIFARFDAEMTPSA